MALTIALIQKYLKKWVALGGVLFFYGTELLENSCQLYASAATTLAFKVSGTIYAQLAATGLAIDNLIELTAANGVAVDGARIKDGLIYEVTSTVVVGTVANAGTVTAAQLGGKLLYQDASGGNVTMTTRTGTQMTSDFPNVAVGQSLEFGVASNHATNTSTIAGGTDVTLTGSGAVTSTGGKFWLTKLTATTWQLARVG